MSWITFAVAWVALTIGFLLGRAFRSGLIRKQLSPASACSCAVSRDELNGTREVAGLYLKAATPMVRRWPASFDS